VNDDRLITDIIRSIAAGSSVNWDAAGAVDTNASTQSLLDELKVIAQIAHVHGVSRSDAETLDGALRDGPLSTWGPLAIVEPVGRGSYGDVYRAWDSRLDRHVALKILRDAESAPTNAPTVQEGRLLARVRHPNVVTVFGADRIDNRVGLWMEFVEGETLDAIVRGRGPLTPSEAVGIGIEVCRGLEAVHQAGLVHRDIKAQNVMRQADGRVVLMDFGAGHQPDAANEKRVTGTPLYLAPEVLAGDSASASSDVYSVGVLLYYLVTASFPTPSTTFAAMPSMGQRQAMTTAPGARGDIPPRLAGVIDQATAPSPARRFASAPS